MNLIKANQTRVSYHILFEKWIVDAVSRVLTKAFMEKEQVYMENGGTNDDDDQVNIAVLLP